jgi:hypothetical protein
VEYIDKIYGTFEIEGVLEEIIKLDVFQRLKRIHQGGAIYLVDPKINHTRFEHSIGVMLLIQKLGGTIEDQIAGLLHDISHTAFSHLIDYVLEIEEEDYHEKRFKEVLSNQALINVLQNYGFQWRDFLELEQYPILEYPLPNLSADRIDYTLRDLYQLRKLNIKEIYWFLEGLQVFENRIVLKSKAYAKWFQQQYQFLTAQYFESEKNKAINSLMKQIIKEGFEKGIIEEADFYDDDFYLIKKLEGEINLSERLVDIKARGNNLEVIKTKKRKINPEILINNQVMKLSEMS